MSDEIKVQVKSKKTRFLFAVVAVIITGLTIVTIVLVNSKGVTAKKVNEQLSLGEKYLSELNYEQAITAYEFAIEIDPKCEEAYVVLVEIYIATNEFQKAERIIEQAEDALGKTRAILEKKKDLEERENKVSENKGAISYDENKVEINEVESTAVQKQISGVTDSFRWVTNEEGGVTIQGFFDVWKTEVIIPEAIEGKKVNKIGTRAFVQLHKLESVVLPTSLQEIEYQAFCECISLKTIEFPSEIQSIGEGAFAYCCSLETVTIPKGVTFIGEGAFRGCDKLFEIEVSDDNLHYYSENGILFAQKEKKLICVPAGIDLQEYLIPDEVEEIGDFAFERCRVTQVTIPNSVKRIGVGAFTDCSLLEHVFIPKSVTKIERDIGDNTRYSVAEENPAYCVDDNVFFSKDKKELLFYVKTKEQDEGTYVVPNGVLRIGDRAFQGARYLKHIEVSSTVTEIGANTFLWSLQTIKIPTSVESIGTNAFSLCPDVTVITPAGSYAETYAIIHEIEVVTK